ncbi:hypothetical protein [Fictibacillus barbaricus]|uniref:SRNA-binding regulator protein Hfq n=1 Tax=Fictibacillus barbaricus TaxID=182136 RepID=A0ABU1TXR3_9BACL|nr:hypothetical protein [Fictibacillus barbaricus]MDR7071997.1 sRNA-binding regulator protein Hfq [Fictibacillus barbaricus]
MYPYQMGNFQGQSSGGQFGFGSSKSPFKKMYKTCLKNKDQHVQIMLIDGISYNGFIEYVDQQNVYFAIPYMQNQLNNMRDSEAQYNVTGYQIHRCMIPLHAVAGVNPAF